MGNHIEAALAGMLGEGESALTLSPDLKSVKALRITTNAQMESVLQVVTFTANERPFFGAEGGMKEYVRLKAHKFTLFTAPPNVDLPFHNVGEGPNMELFYVIRGSSELILTNGERHTISAGTLVFIEDSGSKGRAGRTGPDGYFAINVGYELEA